MELLRITRQIHCKAVEQRATLRHRQYNRDWRTSYSRPPMDPYLTSRLLQNPGGATGTKRPCEWMGGRPRARHDRSSSERDVVNRGMVRTRRRWACLTSDLARPDQQPPSARTPPRSHLHDSDHSLPSTAAASWRHAAPPKPFRAAPPPSLPNLHLSVLLGRIARAKTPLRAVHTYATLRVPAPR